MSGATDVLVGRQGIYDANGLAGYELMFRSVGVLGSSRVTGDQMTAAVIFGAMSIGLQHLVGEHLVFVKADRGVLTGEVPLLLPAERTVVEVPAGIELDDAVRTGCERLVADGFTLALADLSLGTKDAAWLGLAGIAMVDVMMTVPEQLAATVALCRTHSLRPHAVRVTRAEDVPQLAALGFELFQGFALDRPNVVPGRSLEPEAVSRVQAAADLLSGDPDLEDLEKVLRRDPALTYQIMQLASVGRLGETRREIANLHSALVIAGTRQVRNWLALLLARPPGAGSETQGAYLATLLRARACELLAADLRPAQAGLGFAAGMLSALDILLEIAPADIAAGLPLSDELRAAAFDGAGPVGAIVADAMAYQLGTGAPVTCAAEELDRAFARAFAWAVDSVAAVQAPSPVG